MSDGGSPAGLPISAATKLDDRYLVEDGRLYLNGIQALVRLPIDQARRDRAVGLKSGFFISGYPGSPLGGYDLALQGLRHLTSQFGIVHQPGQNEELAATAITGTQMLSLYPSSRYDGLVGIWYGKGPGMDRSGDAMRHGNYMGTSPHGAVVVLSGEDHEAKSSTLPIQQEWAFVHAGIPVLFPSSVREFLEYGLHAVAVSRFSGCWAGMKLVGQLCDGAQTFEVGAGQPEIVLPEIDFEKYQYFRFFPVETCDYERRLYEERHPAVLAYGRANKLNRVMVGTPMDRIGILTAGKSYADVVQALGDLGLEERDLNLAGIRLIKLGLIYPTDTAFLREAARDLDELVVVEEKRGFIQGSLNDALANAANHPIIEGKESQAGSPLFPLHGGMDSDIIAERLGPILRDRLAEAPQARVDRRLREIRAIRDRVYQVQAKRSPNYCSGCPHNISTRLLPGQEAWGAPGCHVFATIIEQPERHIDLITQLGGEGLPWIGLAPFTDRPHIIQNQGDGALWHSGYQNIRFAVAAGVSMTYKILYNGSVANTGGQDPVGAKDVPTLAAMLALDGVSKIAIVAKDPADYRGVSLPPIARVHSVHDYDGVVRDLEQTKGVTVFIYDGECANELRRKQKRGLRPKPTRYVMINEDVCENCGHCGALTNCMSLQKVDTWIGPKTQIHQSSCNQDTACLGGDCPSFMTVDVEPGTGYRKRRPPLIESTELPEPPLHRLTEPYHVYIPGVGGTGILTINAMLGWGALLDGHDVMSYDQTGAAQKWGAVLSSIVISQRGRLAAANKVGLGKADLYLAFDLIAGADPVNLDRCDRSRTAAVINTTLLPSGELVRNVNAVAPIEPMATAIGSYTKSQLRIGAREIAEALFGDYMATNIFALGAAYQAGLLPISAAAIEAAVELNGVAVQQNLQAFRYGRLHQHDPERLVELELLPKKQPEPSVSGLRERCAAELRAWGGDKAAAVYLDFCEYVAMRCGSEDGVTREVVRNLYRLMAYKDEYEVARLHLKAAARGQAGELFDQPIAVTWLLHPPFLRAFGLKRKLRLGGWFKPGLLALRSLRRVRGTPFDLFGYSRMRKDERSLSGWYRELLVRALDEGPDRLLEIARLPDMIRGYGEIKQRNIEQARRRADLLLRARTLPVIQTGRD